MFAARRALHAKSHRSRYTGFYIAAVLFLLLPHHFFFSSTLKAQKFSCYPTVTNPTAKGDNDINRRLYILTIRVICSQKDHQKESDIGEERFLQKLLSLTQLMSVQHITLLRKTTSGKKKPDRQPLNDAPSSVRTSCCVQF